MFGLTIIGGKRTSERGKQKDRKVMFFFVLKRKSERGKKKIEKLCFDEKMWKGEKR